MRRLEDTIQKLRSLDGVEQVVAHSQEYIDNPLRLDWDWRESRVH